MNMTQTSPPIEPDTMPRRLFSHVRYRAEETLKTNGFLHDPEAVRILHKLHPQHLSLEHSNTIHPARCELSDRLLQRWIDEHPKSKIIELGCGLETQAHRLQRHQTHWYGVDHQHLLTFRERFIEQVDHYTSMASDPFEYSWLIHFDPTDEVLITAYDIMTQHHPQRVQQLLNKITSYFHNVHVIFDISPRHIAYGPNDDCTIWGKNGNELKAYFRSRLAHIHRITLHPYGPNPRMIWLLKHMPLLKNRLSHMVSLHGKNSLS